MLKESLRTRGIIIEVGLVPPPLKLDKKTLIEFQTEVESIYDLNEIIKGTNFIQMISKNESGDTETRINLTREKVTVHTLFPDQSIDSLIDGYDAIIKLAGKITNTQIFVPFIINIRKQISTKEKDARLYFAQNLLRLSEKQQRALNRPIQTIGLKLMLPPFIDGVNNASDGIELKIETLNEDLRDIYIEVHHIYSNPIPVQNFQSVKTFIHQTEEFIQNNVLQFLSDGNIEE